LRPTRIAPCIPPHFTCAKNIESFYLPLMVKFANSEFIFAIMGPKLGGAVKKYKIYATIYTFIL